MHVEKVNDTNKEYHSSGYLGKSKLHKILESPAHFKYALENPPKFTPALEFGIAFHCAVLEPEKFSAEYVILPEDFNMRTKANKEFYESIIEGGKTPIKFDDFKVIQGMKESIMKTKYAKALLNGEHETSYYWEDDKTGVKVSCRPDSRRNLNDNEGIIVDLKSCTSAETNAFMRDAMKFGYDMQAAQYKEGVEGYYGIPHRFIFIAVEKTAPYVVNILEADDLFIQHGKDLYRECLGIVKECTETGNWYGYNGSDAEINMLGVPAWLAKEIE